MYLDVLMINILNIEILTMLIYKDLALVYLSETLKNTKKRKQNIDGYKIESK